MRRLALLLALPTLLAGPATAAELVRPSCHPGPGPTSGVLLTVTADPFGAVRVVGLAPGQDGVPRDFAQRAMRAMLTPPCGQFPLQGRNVTYQVRLFPDP